MPIWDEHQMNASPAPDVDPRSLSPDDWDPVFIHSRREAIVIFCVWAAAALWTVPYCYLNGYGVAPENLETVWGVPSWVFWGIGLPWLVADVVTIWLCFGYIQNDDLGEAHEGEDLAEEIAEMHAGDTQGGQS